jgi:hydrogenase maturation protein HypF
VRLPFKAGQILATGAELKNTFCLARDDFAFVSQHIGDMENLETLEHFEASIELFQHLFRVEIERVAHDLHPDYATTQYALGRGWPAMGVQHHQAHLASCLVDNNWQPDDGPVIGVVWDGTGYGLDGHIWGGEVFVGDYRGMDRVAHLEALPMPGGDAAVRNPWRLAFAYGYALTGQVRSMDGISQRELDVVRRQIDRGLNTPLTTAMGRLFDAVAAQIGLRRHVTYEAQAAIELEMLATRWGRAQSSPAPDKLYPYEFEQSNGVRVIRVASLLEAIDQDLQDGHPQPEIGWRFHATLSVLILDLCQQIRAGGGPQTVALSGGCFQNRLLVSLAVPELERAGFRVLLHSQVPCNDGGICLGQIALAHFSQ